jgi:predicted nucleic acid-binding protein
MDSRYVCTVFATNFHLVKRQLADRLAKHFDSTYAVTVIPIVIDTNVFVAGLRSAGGASRAVLRRALGGGLQPLFGNALWMEYQDLLDRPVRGEATTAEERRQVLAAWDTENHFRAMAATGDVRKALAVLDRLDAADAEASAN